MSSSDFILFHRGQQFLQQADDALVFGKPRQVDKQTHFIPLYWRVALEGESRPKYRHVFFDTDRLACLNAFYQSENDWILETGFDRNQDHQLFFFFQNLEDYMIDQISQYSMEWFRNRIPRAQVEDAFRPFVVVSRRSHTPIVRWHVPCDDGVPMVEVVNQFRKKVFPHQFHPGMDIELRIHLAGVQFSQNYCSIVFQVQSVRLFTNRNKQQSKSSPFRFQPTLNVADPTVQKALELPAIPIHQEESDDEMEPTQEEETIQEEPEPTQEVETIQEEPEMNQEEEIIQEEPEMNQEEEVIQEEPEVIQEELEMNQEEEVIQEESKEGQEEEQNREEEREDSSLRPDENKKDKKKKKKKVVKRVFKTARGERVWTIQS